MSLTVSYPLIIAPGDDTDVDIRLVLDKNPREPCTGKPGGVPCTREPVWKLWTTCCNRVGYHCDPCRARYEELIREMRDMLGTCTYCGEIHTNVLKSYEYAPIGSPS